MENPEIIEHYTVLIAEDNRDEQQFLVKMLSEYPNPKFKLMVVPNGKLACEVAEQQLPDIILLDWEMPVMAGIDALDILQKNPKTAHIPVIMVSALSYPEDMDFALSQGAMDYIVKPYAKLQLVGRIKHSIRLAKKIGNR